MLTKNDHKIKLPEKVAFIIKTLEENGYEAFAVGGCVRDALMGRTPNDWDITTSAKPEQVKGLFRRTIDTGIKHGTVTIMLDKDGYEVTTYRIDGEYTDGRHPNEVIFTSNLIEDLKRRDFTINAMAYNSRAGVVDAFDGIKDLDLKTIRCVRDAKERFTEDALRILRALRFSAQLGFSVTADTLEAMKELAPSLAKISKERIHTELDKLVTSPHPEMIRQVQLCGLNKYIFEGATKLNTEAKEVYASCISIMQELPCNHYLRWAALMYFEDKPETILKVLKFDNKTINICSKLIKASWDELPKDKPNLRRMIVKYGKEIFDDYLFTFLYALEKSNQTPSLSLQAVNDLRDMYLEIIADNDCISIGMLAINGGCLIKEGFAPGKELGNLINHLFRLVLDTPSLNEYNQLLAIAYTYQNSLERQQ